MPPKTIMTAEEVEQEIRNSFGKECLMTSHFVNVQGDCNCGTFVRGTVSWQHWINHLFSFVPKMEEEDEQSQD